jgi:hypothetical protein
MSPSEIIPSIPAPLTEKTTSTKNNPNLQSPSQQRQPKTSQPIKTVTGQNSTIIHRNLPRHRQHYNLSASPHKPVTKVDFDIQPEYANTTYSHENRELTSLFIVVYY